jgi:hypothetical protein
VFERFTVAARDAVKGAVEVAGEVRAPQVDTGHLLAALARDGGPTGGALRAAGVTDAVLRPDLAVPGALAGFDPAALSAVGIDFEAVRRAVDEQFGAGSLDRALGQGRSGCTEHLPFAPEAKKALERSLREALARRDRHIGSEHVLLGVLADPAFLAVRLLARHEVDVAALRETVFAARDRRAG